MPSATAQRPMSVRTRQESSLRSRTIPVCVTLPTSTSESCIDQKDRDCKVRAGSPYSSSYRIGYPQTRATCLIIRRQRFLPDFRSAISNNDKGQAVRGSSKPTEENQRRRSSTKSWLQRKPRDWRREDR